MASSTLIFEQLSKKAEKCVRKMTKEERRDFLTSYAQTFRQHSTRGARIKALRSPRKDVYYVYGSEFNRLWEFVRPYIELAVTARFGQLREEDLCDDLMEVRYRLFFILRFYGARPNGHAFGEVLPVIVKSALYNMAQKRFDTYRRRTALVTVPYSESTSDANDDQEFDGPQPVRRDSTPCDDTFARDNALLLSIPAKYRDVVNLLLGNEFISRACKASGVKLEVFREDMQEFMLNEIL